MDKRANSVKRERMAQGRKKQLVGARIGGGGGGGVAGRESVKSIRRET